MNINMKNGNYLVIAADSKLSLNNGISVQEDRHKKSLLWGTIFKCEDEAEVGLKVLYPMYGADELAVSGLHPDKNYFHVIKKEDIIMTMAIDKES